MNTQEITFTVIDTDTCKATYRPKMVGFNFLPAYTPVNSPRESIVIQSISVAE